MNSFETKKKVVVCTTERLWTVFFIQMNEAYQINVLLPMVVFMLRDFGINEQSVGLYQGIFNASFCFCQFLTCYPWGSLSDAYGRRVVLVVGLVFSTISMVALGFAKTFPIALAIRCIGGFFNGNLGVMKAYLADITDSTNRAWAFSILAISWGVGTVIASICGGLLLITHDANAPDDEYIPTTSVLPFWIFHKDFPFLLPFTIGGLVSFIALIFTLIYIHNEKVIYLSIDESQPSELEITSYLSVPLAKKSKEVIEDTYSYSLDAIKMPNMEIGPGGHNSVPTPRIFDALRQSFDKKTNNYKKKLIKQKRLRVEEKITSVKELLQKTRLMTALAIFSLTVIAFMIFSNLSPVFLAQSLDFDSSYIGYNFTMAGAALLIWTYYVQPIMFKKYSYKYLTMIGSFIMTITTILMPTSSYLYNYMDKVGLLIVTGIIQIINISGGSIMFVCVMCYVNNAVPNRFIGKANGISQSLAAISRAIGPPLAGAVWSWSYGLSYHESVYYSYLLAVIGYTLVIIVTAFKIDDYMQIPWEERKQKGLPTILSRKKERSITESISIN